MPEAARTYRIIGRVIDRESRQGLAGLRVEAWDMGRQADDYIAHADTDARGDFVIELDKQELHDQFIDEEPDLYFKVFRDGNLLKETDEVILRNVRPGETEIVLMIGERAEPQPQPEPEPRIVRLAGQVLRKDTQAPLVGYQVAVLLEPAPEPLDLGRAWTDGHGGFSFSFSVPTSGDGAGPKARLQFQVLDQQGETIHEETVELEAERTIVVTLEVPPEALPQPPAHRLDGLAEEIDLDPPDNLFPFLAQQGIHTLEDILHAGGIAHLDNLPVDPANPIVRRLEAHANLSVLPGSNATRDRLVAAGYASTADIGGATLAEFTSRVEGELGPAEAGWLYTANAAIASVLDNVMMERVLEWYHSPEGKDETEVRPLPERFRRRCSCEDCEAAVSPGAYLADLLNYALRHVRRDGRRLTLADLSEEILYQPLSDLPVTCSAAEEEMRQVRLFIEVLRRYRAARGLPADETTEVTYRLAAYKALLEEVGTSYEEIRLARTAEDDERQRLAGRLGVAQEHLEALYLDHADVSETALASVFGLAPTRPDVALPSEPPQIQTWRLENLRAMWEEQDWPDGEAGAGSPLIDPDIITVDHCRHTRTATLWGQRRDAINAQKAALVASSAGVATLAPFDAWLGAQLGAPVSELLALVEAEQNGEDINQRLAERDLDRAAFRRLLAIRRLIERDSAPTADEWEELYDILVQVWKRRQFSAWREEEFDASGSAPRLLLSPDYFQLPTPEVDTFPPPEPPPLPKWRATWQARRDWEQTLEAKIEQRDTMITALHTAVGTVEGAVLPSLRDTLISATDFDGGSLAEKAQDATEKLLLDAQADGCQMITRVGAAVEALQGLLWSLRTGQLQDTHPDLALDAPDFGEEWDWIGSYATWRAAMFVFMYPENILLPALRQESTPAFRSMLQETRNNRRLSPAAACAAAKRYADYFRDVCTLSIEATCLAPTRIHAGDSCDHRATPQIRDRYYMFGRGGATGTVYWSAYDLASSGEQSYWKAVPGLKDLNVIHISGAVPYHVQAEESYLVLVVQARQDGKQTLLVTRFDLSKSTWDASPAELGLPSDEGAFTVVLAQNELTDRPPLLVLHDGSEVYSRSLDPQKSDWDTKDESRVDDTGDEWDRFKIRWSRSQVKVLHTLVQVPDERVPEWDLTAYRSWLIYTDFDDHLLARSASYEISVRGEEVFASLTLERQHTVDFGEVTWLGAVPGQEPRELFVLYRSGPSGTSYRRIGYEIDSGARSLPIDGILEKIARHCGRSLDAENVDLTCAVTGDLLTDEGWLTRTQRSLLTFARNGSLTEAGFARVPVAPVITPADDPSATLPTADRFAAMASLYAISPSFTAAERQRRRELMGWAFDLNAAGDHSIGSYLEEAFYFVPVHLALQLQQRGHYVEALDWWRTVYDYSVEPHRRKIYFGLTQEEGYPATYERMADWLLDPLNPHRIAASRRNTYTRFTLLALVRCLLDYADAEFTRDTVESLPRARTLYLTALELLDDRVFSKPVLECEALIGTLEMEVGGVEPSIVPIWSEIKKRLLTIDDPAMLEGTVAQIQSVLANTPSWDARLAAIRPLVDEALDEVPTVSYGNLLEEGELVRQEMHASLLAQSQVATAAEKNGAWAGQEFVQHLVDSTPTLREGYSGRAGIATDGVFPTDVADLLVPVLPSNTFGAGFAPRAAERIYAFCIPPNPVLEALRLRAALNLHKLRTCRNIAGMERQVDPYAAPTDTVSGLPKIGAGGQLVLPGIGTLQPTPYRYPVLIERAKQLVQLAAQVEANMLAALEKRDAEYYSLLKARQDVEMTQQGVQLQCLRVSEAEHGATLAELQQERAQLQVDYYQGLLDIGYLEAELNALLLMRLSVALPTSITVTGPVVSVSSSPSGAAQTYANILSTMASYERRRQEWEFQRNLAMKDVSISSQQVTLAQDQIRIVAQEQEIAKMQADHAKEAIDFLSHKFSNVELYDWMSDILEGVYSFFLQHATATAKLAESQLAFERQEVPPAIIQADYWQAPSEDVLDGANGNGPYRRGLTGSARLLQDIYELDQYAFDTDKRKLQLTKIISLARLAPAGFQCFRETGLMRFDTPLALFDRDFPGHYLRLIKRVRTSVVALIPPTEGIRATLSALGMSRVVVDGDIFQTVTVRRSPESVALTAPMNATGLFELTPEGQDMLLPFEGMGVDTSWEFRMPKASNQFDYRTIADVLITLEYTALNSYDYQQQVIRELDRSFSADRPFSFRQEFADQWYDLNNPELLEEADQMIVRFRTERGDFPPNVDGLTLQQVVLYFSRRDGAGFEVPAALHFRGSDTDPWAGGSDQSINGIISTRRGNAASWLGMLDGRPPIGEWELNLRAALDDGRPVAQVLKNEDIEDILFVITYSGRTPPWPA